MVKERQRESRKRLHLQRRSSALKPPAVQRERDRYREEEREREGAKEAAAAARFGERVHSRSQRWERKERKAMESKSATSSSPKGPLLRLPFALPQIA